jgi:hypothetical protein
MTPAKHFLLLVAHLLVVGQFLLLTGGCGYSNPRTRVALHDQDNDGVIRVYLSMWNNQTNLLGFQGQIQQGLIQTLTASNRFYLTQNRASADYILGGTIYAVEIPGLSYGAFDRAVEVRAEVTLGYQLVDARSNKVALEKKKYIKRETFRVGGDAVRTRSNEDAALATLAVDLADDIDIQLFYFFTRDKTDDNQQLIPSDDIELLD